MKSVWVVTGSTLFADGSAEEVIGIFENEEKAKNFKGSIGTSINLNTEFDSLDVYEWEMNTPNIFICEW